MSNSTTTQNVLFDWYRRYFGEPDGKTDVYLGFGLFFGGIAMGVFGLAVFLWSAAVTPETTFYWNLRTIAVTLAALGLPALMLGIVVLLPVDTRAAYAAGVGSAVCLLAMGVFVNYYPYDWNVSAGPDYSTQGIAIYASGLAVVIAATGAALVGHQLEQARATRGDQPTATDSSEDVSDERVAADIDEAMENADLTWGGVSEKKTRRLRLNNSDTDDVDRSSFDTVEAKTTRSTGTGVDSAVSGLRNLQGGQTDTASGSGTSSQASALSDLKERKSKESLGTDDRSVFKRAFDAINKRLGRS